MAGYRAGVNDTMAARAPDKLKVHRAGGARPAARERRRAMEAEALIERYVEPNPHHPGPADVRLREYCVPVWALIGYWKAAEGDVERVAADYRLPREAVE